MIGNVAYTIVILGIVLGVLVFVHELGHYISAKIFGVWVHRFAIGIGKPVPGLTFRRGETEWAIAWLPLGGYVKMASRDHEPASSVLEGDSADEVPADRVFEAKPVWQRMIIILSGVMLNVVFALLIFTGLAWKNGRRYDPTTTIGHITVSALPPEAKAFAAVRPGTRITAIDGRPARSWDDITDRITAGSQNQIVISLDSGPDVVIPLKRDALEQRSALATAIEPEQPPVLGLIGANSPAQAAGLAVGDSIVAIDGAPVVWWTDAVDRIQPAAGKPLQIDVIRDGVRKTLIVVPRAERQVPEDSTTPMVGKIGVGSRPRYLTEPLGLWGAMKAGGNATLSAGGLIFRTLRGLINGQVPTKSVGGPILIGQMAAQEARAGVEPLIAFIGLISVNLAIINLLPIPVLDGGAFLFLLVEGVIRRPLPVRVREAFSMVGLALVFLLMVIAFKNDIFRLFGH
jgi:regulator of sigma E protease